MITEFKSIGSYTLTKIVSDTQKEVKILYGKVSGGLIKVGSSVVVSDINGTWWCTSTVTEIEKLGKGCRFYTLNSEYILEEL